MVKAAESTQNSSSAIKKEVFDGGFIWAFWLDCPPANILTKQLLDELSQSIDQFESEKTARVLIVSGAGDRFFSGGVSIDEISSIKSAEDGVRLARIGQELFNRIEGLLKPVIASVNGLCIGGGNELAIACHYRVASEKAKFQQPEINLGIIPAFGGTQRLPRIIGLSRARKMILTGESISADEAFEYGLVDGVFKQDEVFNQALHMARTLAKKSQIAIAMSQDAIAAGAGGSASDGYIKELENFGKVCDSPNMREGLNAFKEKRQPRYE